MGQLLGEVEKLMEADLSQIMGKSLSPTEMFMFLIGHFENVERAIKLVAAEVDRLADDAVRSA